MTWRRMDLHLHTPASSDYQHPAASPLDLLRRAEERDIEIVAFTDHNSVRGYADLWREIEDLELLEYLGRLQSDEEARLQEYRRLLDSVLLLPGFEFTATFGFHILAIFPQRTSVRLMEHVLLTLGVPEEKFGSSEVGATTDVLSAYRILHQHGALVIGAHVNSANGIAMQGLRFGGQTKIAYTQDRHLHALEVTDLGSHNRRSTAHFFSGIKPEYPRRMHCIQGSDAHRLERDPQRETSLGIGDRATEVLLPDLSFDALRALFESDDFDRTRPYVPVDEPAAILHAARTEGNTRTQVFYERHTTKRTGAAHVLRDIVAFANSDGGTVYIGASPFEKRPLVGVENAAEAIAELESEIAQQITPAPPVALGVMRADKKDILTIEVPRGDDRPYALAPGGIFVRREAESVPANRDEIVAMVRGVGLAAPPAPAPTLPAPAEEPASAPVAATPSPGPDGGEGRGPRNGRRGGHNRQRSVPELVSLDLGATPTDNGHDGGKVPEAEAFEGDSHDRTDGIVPRTGVEIVDVVEEDGVACYSLRDLRNGEITHEVTRDTPRRLWRYAIHQFEEHQTDDGQIRWEGDFGCWRGYKPRGGDQRYNLAYRGDGRLRIFYGVTDEGMDERWRAIAEAQRR